MACDWSILAHRLSTGLFSGMAVSVSLMGLPALRSTSDPLPAWIAYYENGKNFAIATTLTTIGAGLYNYVKSGNKMFLLSVGLHFAIIPFTALAMGPGIKKLYSLNAKTDADQIRSEIEDWNKLHWIRIFFGMSAFLAVLLYDKKCIWSGCSKLSSRFVKQQ